jgi:hypothetical protein
VHGQATPWAAVARWAVPTAPRQAPTAKRSAQRERRRIRDTETPVAGCVPLVVTVAKRVARVGAVQIPPAPLRPTEEFDGRSSPALGARQPAPAPSMRLKTEHSRSHERADSHAMTWPSMWTQGRLMFSKSVIENVRSERTSAILYATPLVRKSEIIIRQLIDGRHTLTRAVLSDRAVGDKSSRRVRTYTACVCEGSRPHWETPHVHSGRGQGTSDVDTASGSAAVGSDWHCTPAPGTAAHARAGVP